MKVMMEMDVNGGPKTGQFLKVHNSWDRYVLCTSKYLFLYQQ